MIDLVVFDMDGVLSRPNHARRLEVLSRYTGSSPEHIHRAVWESDVEPRCATTTPILETFEIARRVATRVPITTLTNNNALLRECIAEIFPAAAELFGASFLA